MHTPNIISIAESIARAARAESESAEREATIEEFERSENRSLRSLARVYRMLQWPPGL